MKKGPVYFFGLLLLILTLLTFIFAKFNISYLDSVKFYLALFFVTYIPGQSFCLLLKLKVPKLEMVTLSLIAGMTLTTLVYRISGILRLPSLFFFWLGISSCFFFYRLIKHPPKKKSFTFRITWVGIGFVSLLLVVLSILFIDNYRNGIELSNGSIRLFMHYYDGFTRNSLVRELSHSIPPQMPFAAGLPISYHYDMNLFVSFFYKYLGLDVLDLLHRLTITFFFVIVLLSVFIFIRQWSRSEGVALLGTFLVLFGSGGFSYIFGLISKYPGFWGKIFYSLYYLDLVSINPILPGVAVLFTGFFCIQKYFKSGGFSWLFLGSFFLAIVTGYKMTFVFPVLAALGGTALIYYFRHRKKSSLNAFILTAVMTFPFLLISYLLNLGGPKYVLKIEFNNWVVFSLLDCRFNFLAQTWSNFINFSSLTPVNAILAFFVLILFFLGSFGLPFFSLPLMVKEFFSAQKDKIMTFFLVCLFIAGIIFFFWASPYLGNRTKNWIIVDIFKLSVLILIVFWSSLVGSILRKKSRTFQIAAVLVIILLSIPNVAQFIWAKLHYPQTKIVNKLFLETCQYLNTQTSIESVVLHSTRVQHVCFFADRRVVLDSSPHSYLSFHLTPDQYKERLGDITNFFEDPSRHGDVLSKYNVSYVWVKRRVDSKLWKSSLPEIFHCYTEQENKKTGQYVKTYSLHLVYKNFRYALFRVEATDEIPPIFPNLGSKFSTSSFVFHGLDENGGIS